MQELKKEKRMGIKSKKEIENDNRKRRRKKGRERNLSNYNGNKREINYDKKYTERGH